MEYKNYVFEDCLLSPINGHRCKRLTKQNIGLFGFKSLDDLRQQYPGFPSACLNLKKIYLSNAQNASTLRSNQARINQIENEIDYHKDPKKCDNCKKIIPFRSYGSKFCSKSCSAIFNNKPRKKEDLNKKAKHKLLKFDSKIVKKPKLKLISLRLSKDKCTFEAVNGKLVSLYELRKLCKQCRVRNRTAIYGKYCNSCVTNIRHYRSLCKFDFNVWDYPSDLDLTLLKKHGWFSPNGHKRKNNFVNLNGVSKDHLYTISDGFKNKVDPLLLKHPANCKIMLHNGPGGNNSKKKSSITLDELKSRIEIWNKKYGEC